MPNYDYLWVGKPLKFAETTRTSGRSIAGDYAVPRMPRHHVPTGVHMSKRNSGYMK